jgi:exodeoxyribonuclease V alpha subunit
MRGTQELSPRRQQVDRLIQGEPAGLHDAPIRIVGRKFRQLPAVGRGGVLDHAARWSDQLVSLDVIHRSTREVGTPDGVTRTVPDREYAELTIAMRTGDDPGRVFDTLLAAGRIDIHATTAEAVADLTEYASGFGGNRLDDMAVVAGTREQVAALNATDVSATAS